MDIKDYERIMKAIINWNRQPMQWDRKFLEYQDYSELIIEETDTTIVLNTKMSDKI